MVYVFREILPRSCRNIAREFPVSSLNTPVWQGISRQFAGSIQAIMLLFPYPYSAVPAPLLHHSNPAAVPHLNAGNSGVTPTTKRI
jgi:hypothetical protein